MNYRWNIQKRRKWEIYIYKIIICKGNDVWDVVFVKARKSI